MKRWHTGQKRLRELGGEAKRAELRLAPSARALWFEHVYAGSGYQDGEE